jgi:Fe2+ or Zn2+ uptake regulation protein
MLSDLVYEIVQNQHLGIKHSEVVKEVLLRGYCHQGNHLSEAIYEVLKNFVNRGVISRIQNERLERHYKVYQQTDVTKSCA